MNCDFCGDPTTDDAERTYYTRPGLKLNSVLDDGTVFLDSGEYLACEVCHTLIKERRLGSLKEHAVETFIRRNPQAVSLTFNSDLTKVRRRVSRILDMVLFSLGLIGEIRAS